VTELKKKVPIWKRPLFVRQSRAVTLMNWANRLTLGRLALTILFVLALNSVWSYGRSVALVLFVLAGISDYFDGEIARRYGTVTKFGKLMDPLVDKVMMACRLHLPGAARGGPGLGGDDCGGA
jgi:phosphatidylglycerophosphate synthase